jgi:capsular exopolysaccharide synthesis family protein
MVNFAYGNAGPLTLTVTSPSPGEGKSLISTNLAVAFAEVGKRTLLVDADTRRGDAHELLGVSRSPGLTDYLRERANGDIIQGTEYDHLDFIGSGTRGTSTPELLASSRMHSFLGTLKRTYDVIIVDSPPLGAGGDPVLLAGLTGNMVLVIRAGSTEKNLALAKLDMLTRLPIRVLGAVLNHVEAKGMYRYYYSSSLPEYAPKGEEQPALLAESGSSLE